VTFSRLFADRRAGTDRRAEPRRQEIALVNAERRRVVDRRRGAERRSTLDRRGRAARAANAERPVEHVRNALQLLREVALTGELSAGPSEDLGAAIDRLHRAVSLLERSAARC
jgi:Flp pilus assembly protein TadD